MTGDSLSGTALLLLEADGALKCLRPQRQAQQAPGPLKHTTEPLETGRQLTSISSKHQV